MSNDLASYTPATDTTEIRSSLRGPAIFAAETVELLVPTKPEIHPVRRTIPARVRAWSYLAAATFGAGIAHLAATGVLS